MQGLSCAFQIRENQDDLVAKLLAENARLKQAVTGMEFSFLWMLRQSPVNALLPALHPQSPAWEAVDRESPAQEAMDTQSPTAQEALDTQSQTAQEAPDTQFPTAQARMRDTPMQLPLQDQSRRLQTLQNRSHPARSNRGMHQKPSKQRSCRS